MESGTRMARDLGAATAAITPAAAGADGRNGIACDAAGAAALAPGVLDAAGQKAARSSWWWCCS
jgi:hypothetical protein